LLEIRTIEAFKYVYLQSLGELGLDGYDASYAPTIYWVFFFASSLFLQITLLNVLIAIMGDTYERIQGVNEKQRAKEICSLLRSINDTFLKMKSLQMHAYSVRQFIRKGRLGNY